MEGGYTMKRFFFLLLVILSTFILKGCYGIENKPISIKEKKDEKNLEFEVENIVLSKGFLSIEPNVEVYAKTNSIKLLASLGIIESSGITIDKITKSNNNINIYVNRLLDETKVQLAIPQIMINIASPIDGDLDDFNFNIINQNYEPLNLKYNKKQVLNHIYSQFKISSNTVPTVTLTKPKDDIIWNISFQNIYDKENYKSPLSNLNVKMDALTGKVLESHKENISNYIDDGHLLDYIPNKAILYKKKKIDGDSELEVLCSYNMETKENKQIYTAQGKITSASFSPEHNYIAILEANDKKSDVYIITDENNIVYKITPVNILAPRLIRWQDEDNLYFVNVEGERATLFSYNITNNNHTKLLNLDFVPEELDVLDKSLLLVKDIENNINNQIFISKNGIHLDQLDIGFGSKFYNENTIIHMKSMEDEDRNILQIHNLEKGEVKTLDYNISNFFPIDDENIGFVEKNTSNNDYTFYRYNIKQGYTLPIANINNDKIYYDARNNIGYMSLNPPKEENPEPIIYSVDLNKLSVGE